MAINEELSRAIFISYGEVPDLSGQSVESKLKEAFGEIKGTELFHQVGKIVEEIDNISVDWANHTLASASKFVVNAIHLKHPDINDEALDALYRSYAYANR
ncbi:MAG: hypothetical protein LBG61_02850 [Burkholderiales bacterium]|jgi:hypothetical protein|nr:hypothetical protein [Burkholderiales bacterium]